MQEDSVDQVIPSKNVATPRVDINKLSTKIREQQIDSLLSRQ